MLNRLTWAYFFLLMVEGALRKWVLPSLATPLLIIRDPVAVLMIIIALKNNLLKPNIYLTGIVFVAIISIFTALFIGHGNLYVALFGARIFILHFPVIFIIGKIFERKDVLMMGKALLWISIPMVILIALQFYSPQSAWVNKGIGTDEGGGFSGAMGFFRPPATFSFASGTTGFFSLVACFVFYFWLSKDNFNRWIIVLATVAVMASIPLSISRTLLFSVILTVLFALMAIVKKPEYLGKMLLGLFLVIAVFIVFSDSAVVKTPLEAFSERFTLANEAEGGLKGVAGDRFLGGMFEAVIGSSEKPFFGFGIGMGTNVGAMLLSGNKNTFLISEEEWGRILGEQGPLLGLAVIVLRVLFCIQLFIAAYRQLQLADILPWMLLNFAVFNIAQSQWGQPTSLGFSIIIGGLLLAALKGPGTNAEIPSKDL